MACGSIPKGDGPMSRMFWRWCDCHWRHPTGYRVVWALGTLGVITAGVAAFHGGCPRGSLIGWIVGG